MLIVGQEAIAIVPLAVVKMIDQALKISGVVMVEQRNAKGFFRAKVVIERAFRHLRCFQQFAQTHTGKPPMHAELLAGGQDMFSGVTFTVLVHGAHCNRPIGLMQVIIKKCRLAQRLMNKICVRRMKRLQ